MKIEISLKNSLQIKMEQYISFFIFLCSLVGLTSHLGDSGMKNNPKICNKDGITPENKINISIRRIIPIIFIFLKLSQYMSRKK